jgi:flagellar motility protein MotE (MotC chaperone)
MSKIPRLLPLVGVAIGGVIAVNALSGAHALPQLLSATQAAAEEALHPAKGKHGKANAAAPNQSETAGPTKAQSALPATAAGQPPGPSVAPVCAPSASDLAKAAGLSPAELQVLQSLQTRRGQIDDREKDLDTEVQLLNAAEAKLDGKLKSMNSLKGDIQALMGQADQKTQAEVDRLTVVYSKMKPADAAAVMAQLDDKVRLPIAASMKPAILSAILGKMGTLEAKDLTEKLAHRFAGVQALAQAANAPAPAPPAAPAAPPAKDAKGKDAQGKNKAKPAQTADADTTAADDAAPADVAPARKAPPKKHIAKVAPKKAPAKPKSLTAQAKADEPQLPAKPEPYPATKAAATPSTPPAAAPVGKSS